MDDWFDLPRTSIYVRRNHVFEDGIKAAKKPDFDVTKLLQVPLYLLCSVSAHATYNNHFCLLCVFPPKGYMHTFII